MTMAAAAVIASYNTHGGVGLDFRFAPRRIARVVLELGADIIALQELTARAAGFDMLEELRLDTGYHAIGGPTYEKGGAKFGLTSRMLALTYSLRDALEGGCS